MFKIRGFNIIAKAMILIACSLFAYSQPARNSVNTKACSQNDPNDLDRYAGRFAMDGGLVLVSRVVDGELTVRPIVWTSVQTLRRTSGDSFGIEGRDDRKIAFGRDAGGCVDSVTINGFGSDGTFRKLGGERVPIELLLSGEPEQAARSMINDDTPSGAKAVSLARTVLEMVPSKVPFAIRFLNSLSVQFPRDASVFSALGDGYISTGELGKARISFQRARGLDPKDAAAIRGLRRLGLLSPTADEKAAGWTVPFPLDRLFAPPTEAETMQAEADWATRDLAAKDVAEVAEGKIDLGNTKADVRIISHTIHGQKNYGAIIIPRGAETGIHPAILDLKGVSPSFFPLDLNHLISPEILGDRQGDFIYFVPSFRGETLKFGGKDYVSEGDPTDSWDGATDDSLAFLNAALSVTPQADKSRIAVFGKSRGGTLAMLAGIRDKRIKKVVSWSGPVDWFELMGANGWPESAIVADALLKRVEPQEDGGQFVRTFLAKAISGERNLAQVRLHMIESSPLYFADRLPPFQAYYGVEDRMVPVRNGRALERALQNRDLVHRIFYHAEAGHDLNPKLAYPESKKFLLGLLSK